MIASYFFVDHAAKLIVNITSKKMTLVSNKLIYQDPNVRIYENYLEYTYRSMQNKQHRIITFNSPAKFVAKFCSLYLVSQNKHITVFDPLSNKTVENTSGGIHSIYQVDRNIDNTFSGLLVVDYYLDDLYNIWLYSLTKKGIILDLVDITEDLDELLYGPSKNDEISVTKCTWTIWSIRPIRRSIGISDIIVMTIN